jgi:transposase
VAPRFQGLHTAERKRVDKDPDASAPIIDSQSVKTTEEGARSNGYDAHKQIKGRKRHLLADTLGLPLSVYVILANVQDRAGARCLSAGLGLLVPHPQKIWADGAYGSEELAGWREEQGGWVLEIVERNPQTKGFKVLPKRWIVERTFSWLIRNRRLSKDHERRVQTSETLVKVAAIRLIYIRRYESAYAATIGTCGVKIFYQVNARDSPFTKLPLRERCVAWRVLGRLKRLAVSACILPPLPSLNPMMATIVRAWSPP